VLPDHHHDERASDRVDEHIEAFLEPPRPRRRRPKAVDRPRRPVELDTRPDWLAAVRHESARHIRYGRPATVLLIELSGPEAEDVDRLARVVVAAIRAEARETDRAVRFTASSFRMLLPETGDRAARSVADRLDRAFLAVPEVQTLGGDLTIDVAVPTRFGTIEDALADAERRAAVRAAEVAG
jgi:GGDEF domain-containing protein